VSALELPNTGDFTINSLQALQVLANRIPDTELRIGRTLKIASHVGALGLLDKECMLSTAMTYAAEPGEDSLSHMFPVPMIFSGKVANIRYLYSPETPVDSLALDVVSPRLFDDLSPEVEAFRQLTFQVPILAIQSCIVA